MLFQCDIISAFWIAFQHWWCERTLRTLELNECNVIYGWHNDTQFKDVLNYVTLVAKYSIFCCFQDNTAVTFDRFPPFLSNKIDALRQLLLKTNSWKSLIRSGRISFDPVFFFVLFPFDVYTFMLNVYFFHALFLLIDTI